MMRAVLAACLFAGIFVGLSARAGKPDLQSLYKEHRYFELREAVESSHAPAFYQAIVAAAFNDPRAETLLKSVVKSAPHSSQAADAREQLEALYLRTGRYPEVLIQIDEALKANPSDADAKGQRALVSALPQAQATGQFQASQIRCRRTDSGGVMIPVLIDGKSGNYAIDSDSNISTISESEAQRLGLAVRDVSPDAMKARGAIGAPFAYRVAVADSLVIGGLRLRHVAFLVLRNDQEPFVDMPAGQRALIGLPVLLVFRTVRWDRAGKFEFGFPSAPGDSRKSNIYFDELDIIAGMGFQQHRIGFVLDTGSDYVDFWPRFAQEFANYVNKTGKKTSWQTTGFDGTEKSPGISVPEITLRVGGFSGAMRPGRVFLQQIGGSPWYYGRLGLPFFSQARRVTLDFPAMTLNLE